VITFDGIRSQQKLWFAKKLLRDLEAAGIDRKTTEYAGYQVSAWRDGEYSGGRINSPAGIAVLADTAMGYDLYVSEPFGAPAIRASSPSIGARRPAYIAPFSIPHAAMVPNGIDFADVYFDRFPDVSPEDSTALRARWLALGVKVAVLQGAGLSYLPGVKYGSLVSSPHLSVFAETGYAIEGVSDWTLSINVLAGNNVLTMNLAPEDLAPYIPGLTGFSNARATKVSADDMRVFCGYSDGASFGVFELKVTPESVTTGLDLMGYATGGNASTAAVTDLHCLPLCSGGSVIDYATMFQDANGRPCWMPIAGGIIRATTASTYDSIASAPLPTSGTAHSAYDVTLANGGSYALIYWHHMPLSDPATVQGLYWGSPFTGTWASIGLPAGDVLAVRPLHCASARRVMLAAAYTPEDGSVAYLLDTAASMDWRRLHKISTDRLDNCALSVYGAHEYAFMQADYPSAQHVMERFQ
jgi:hypothetical protein